MHDQLSEFINFAVANRGRRLNTTFLAVEDTQPSQHPVGVRIELYQDYGDKRVTIELPSAPTLLQATSGKLNSVTLSWQPPKNGADWVRNYEVRVRKQGRNPCIRTMLVEETSTTIRKLETKTNYT